MATAELKNLSYEEKYNLATNEGTPTEILAILAKDIDPRIRKIVARNENTPFETLTALTQDECPYVREAATQALSERKVKNKCDMVK